MVELGAEAARQIQELKAHYEDRDRPEATRNLILAVEQAQVRIGRFPDRGLAAPRSYPDLAREGRRWIKEGRYWFAYSLTNPPIILAVFFETANIPGRL